MTETNQDIIQLITTSRDKFRALVDGLDDDVMSIDESGRIIVVNKSLARQLNLHPREIVGRPCHEVLQGFDAVCPKKGLSCPSVKAWETKQVEIELHELPAQEGALHPTRFIEVRSMPILKNGRVVEVIVIRRDVTLQKIAEIQLQEYSEKLEKMVQARTVELMAANRELTAQRNQLEEANIELLGLQNLKEDLTNMVVHDLKGPLSEIQANIAMMFSEPLTEFQSELLEAAKLGGEDLLRMVTNLLDVSRLEENRMVLDPELIDLPKTISEILDRHLPMAHLAGVRLNMAVARDIPLLEADRALFERILANLLSNALAYTPEDGEITVNANVAGDQIVIQTIDTGYGIPLEMQERIFDKFSQGRRGKPKTSSGLGLTFCRMAVEAHGGRIGVESEEGGGSTFSITFPIRKDRKRDLGAPA